MKLLCFCAQCTNVRTSSLLPIHPLLPLSLYPSHLLHLPRSLPVNVQVAVSYTCSMRILYGLIASLQEQKAAVQRDLAVVSSCGCWLVTDVQCTYVRMYVSVCSCIKSKLRGHGERRRRGQGHLPPLPGKVSTLPLPLKEY